MPATAPTVMAEGTFPATEAASGGAFMAPLRAPLLNLAPAAELTLGRRLKQVEVRCAACPAPACTSSLLPTCSRTPLP